MFSRAGQRFYAAVRLFSDKRKGKIMNTSLPGALTDSISDREIRHSAIARMAAAQGMVLLENDGTLPLADNACVALYGGGARYTIKGGTGSGSVNSRKPTDIDTGLRRAGLRIMTDDWLDEYDRLYRAAREQWEKDIYAMSVPGDFNSLYRAHASNPLPMPAGPLVTDGNKADTDTAIYVISRVSGEGADRKAAKGDYYLSDEEYEMLRSITEHYDRTVVVLNVGGVMDLSFADTLRISAIVLMMQAGIEGGSALADILTGKVNPSGRLTDTWAVNYGDYPASATFSHNNGNLIEEKYYEGIYVGYRYFDSFNIKPRYPFGYGLSYTDFSMNAGEMKVTGSDISVTVTVTNTGAAAGKQVVLLFAACPDGRRIKEAKRLVAFTKTKELLPGQSQDVTLSFGAGGLASYHAGRSSWYYDAGDYYLLVGTNAQEWTVCGKLHLGKEVWERRLTPVCPLADSLKELEAPTPARTEWTGMLSSLTSGKTMTADLYPAAAVKAGEPGPEPEKEEDRAAGILARMTDEEKANLVCGAHSSDPAAFIGSAAIHVPGAAGETSSCLTEKFGIQPAVMADGPAGLRLTQRYQIDNETGKPILMTPYQGLQNRIFRTEFLREGAPSRYQFCTAIPIGTLLAQSFDTELMESVGRMIAAEMEEFNISLWLAPGMNIHRDPLCGRNFEYYSEDPLVSGKMAAAITRGVQSVKGRGVTIKHFACNNQEENRRGVSSIVSERALREIYLKGFEIAVKEAMPAAIMTSYNKINGIHTANSYDLCTVIARQEWGFEGIIMTDWTVTNSNGGGSAAKCVRAGNDLIMPGRDSDVREILEALREDNDQSLPSEYLDACCLRIMKYLLSLG